MAAASEPLHTTFIKDIATSTDMDNGIPTFYRFILEEFKKNI